MKKTRKKHNKELKSRLAIEALKGRYSIDDLSSSFDVHASLIHAWRQKLVKSLSDLFGSGTGKNTAEEKKQVASLERRIEALRKEQELMRKAVMHLDLHSRRELVDEEDSDLSILRKSRLLGLHRSGIYYAKGKTDASSATNHEDDGDAVTSPEYSSETTPQ